MKDQINYTIEEDGTISIKTDKISPTNHVAADQLLGLIRKLAGGTSKQTRRLDVPIDISGHTHDGHTHTH